MWYYRQADQETGPFDRTVLDKLKEAGVINDATPVKNSESEEWRPFSEVVAKERAMPHPQPVQAEQRYYHLNANREPVGPFDRGTLHRLYLEGVIQADTLVAGKGEVQWTPLLQLLELPTGQNAIPQPPPFPTVSDCDASKFRSFEQFALMMGVTLTFYLFYVVPSYSRDM